MSLARYLSKLGALLNSSGQVPLAGLASDVSTAISNATPSGAVAFYAMNTAPTGWLKANGAAVSRTTYAALFTAIGTTFGAGDGSTTFNVPDMRGYFPRGWVDNGSVDSGRAFGSTQTGAIQSHTHTTPAKGSSVAAFGFNAILGTADAATGSIATASTGSTETRPVNVALLACIKY